MARPSPLKRPPLWAVDGQYSEAKYVNMEILTIFRSPTTPFNPKTLKGKDILGTRGIGRELISYTAVLHGTPLPARDLYIVTLHGIARTLLQKDRTPWLGEIEDLTSSPVKVSATRSAPPFVRHYSAGSPHLPVRRPAPLRSWRRHHLHHCYLLTPWKRFLRP